MLFRDTAVFALVMILMGLLLTASVFAVGLIVSLFFGRRHRPREGVGKR